MFFPFSPLVLLWGWTFCIVKGTKLRVEIGMNKILTKFRIMMFQKTFNVITCSYVHVKTLKCAKNVDICQEMLNFSPALCN